MQAATAKKLERLIKGLSTGKLRKRPAPANGRSAKFVAHLADAEIVCWFSHAADSGRAGYSHCGV